jgi:hypothetical protein
MAAPPALTDADPRLASILAAARVADFRRFPELRSGTPAASLVASGIPSCPCNPGHPLALGNKSRAGAGARPEALLVRFRS